MQITRVSPFTGKSTTAEMDVTQEQMDEFNSPNRRMIQDIFPNLSGPQREFIKTGYTAEDWDILFGVEE